MSDPVDNNKGIGPPRKKILCVDDDPYILSTLMRFFRNDEYEVMLASSAEQGEELISRSGPVDVVLCDFRMPGINGIDFLKQVHRTSPDTNTILLSGSIDNQTLLAALADNFLFQFLPKPWCRSQLRATIDAALNR
ncbi:MAG: hypothetical protein C0618_00385 [Desulfuromonas sp.]|nr:MAG: hypothetical protein C0618_00385 [Desulfuromonas sp.]